MYQSCMATCDAFLKDASVNTSTWEIFTDILSFSFMDDILSFSFSKHFELNTKDLYGYEPYFRYRNARLLAQLLSLY